MLFIALKGPGEEGGRQEAEGQEGQDLQNWARQPKAIPSQELEWIKTSRRQDQRTQEFEDFNNTLCSL